MLEKGNAKDENVEGGMTTTNSRFCMERKKNTQELAKEEINAKVQLVT